MGIFGSKGKVVWVPVNEKLKAKCDSVDSWSAKESFVGWRVQNDGKQLMQAVGQCESCSNYDFSYNGLGDNEAEALGKAIQQICRSKKPYPPVKNAFIYGTLVKLNVSNNNIHAKGIAAIMKAVDSEGDMTKLFSLEDLNLSNNFAGPDGAASVGNCMKGNRILKKINLAWNNIGNQGLISLFGGIGSQHSKGKIVIAFNHFDITNLEFREWFGEVKPASKLAKLNISPPESVFTGWDEAGLNDVQAIGG